MYAEVEIINYTWRGLDEDPRPDDAVETRIRLVRKDLYAALEEERNALKEELKSSLHKLDTREAIMNNQDAEIHKLKERIAKLEAVRDAAVKWEKSIRDKNTRSSQECMLADALAALDNPGKPAAEYPVSLECPDVTHFVIRQCDDGPKEVYHFTSLSDAEAFYARASLQWSQCFLVRRLDNMPKAQPAAGAGEERKA